MSMLAEVGQYVDASFAELNLGTTMFLGQLPEAPDLAVALHQGPGIPDFMLGAEDGVPQAPATELQRLQIVNRVPDAPTSYVDAERWAWRIYRLLSVTNVTLGNTRYLLIEPVEIPLPLEEDKRGRISFVCNYNVQKEPSL